MMFKAVSSRLKGRSPKEVGALALLNIVHGVRGLRPSAWAARRRDLTFDRRWGTETSGLVSLSTLDIEPARARHGVRYQPSNGAALALAVAEFGINPTGWTFVDYGSGKGRIVMLAAAMGFARAIGVEFSPELCRIAEKNAASFASRGGARIAPEIVKGDAGAFQPPPGPVIAYLYNPFGPPVIDEVAARLEEKAARDEPVLVIYVDPRHLSRLVDRYGWTVAAADADLALIRVR